MYESFFGMSHTPFARDLPTECLFENPVMKDVLGRLLYVADKAVRGGHRRSRMREIHPAP